MNRHITTLLIVLCLSTKANSIFAKGAGGKYTIQIQVLNSITKQALTNSMFIVNGDTLQSDHKGMIVYELKWRSACAYRLNTRQKLQVEKNLNPEYISIQYSGIERRFKNKWRKYGFRQYKRNTKRTQQIKTLFLLEV